MRAGTRILNFITKLDVQFDQDTVYRLLASPQWVSQDSLLPTDPGIITGSHQTLADDLFFPCPEPPPDWDDHAAEAEAEAEEDETGEPSSSWPRTAPKAADTGTLPLKNSPAPDPLQTSRPEIAICCFPLDLTPKNQREKSAKLPKKSPLPSNKTNNINQICPVEKNPAKNSHEGRESTAPPAVKQACTHHVEPQARQTIHGKLKRQTENSLGKRRPSCR